MDLAPRRFGDTVVLHPVGRIDYATADAFADALFAHLDGCAAGQDRVVLDMSGVQYIASAGLRALMLASKRVKRQGGVIVIAAMQEVVQEIFEISKFTLLFDTFPSVREALAKSSPTALAAFDAS
jgi:anti-sigma B factor antagonist/stage II sporulation protein AA (anti-sigma F factor antagonist)